MPSAARDGQVDVGMGFSTDARIAALDLVILEDDRGFFPVYNPAPVLRRKLREDHPDLEAALNAVSRRLDPDSITRLNYRVDIDKEDPQSVARAWLREQGLL